MSAAFDVRDLFGGPGGWAEGLRILGMTEVGLEWDHNACRTRAAAGHPVIRTDVALYPLWPFKDHTGGLIASAPCQAYSRAGKRLGIADVPLVHQAVTDLAKGRDTREELLAFCRDKRSLLAAEPMRWLYGLRPEWTCMEEVPDVLPLWQQYVQVLREWGYSAWCGILNSADYGVPQTRQRAILIASRMRDVAPPEPTHAKVAEQASLFGPGRARKTAGGNEFQADDPSWALTEKARSWTVRSSFGEPTNGAHERDPFQEPAHTLTEKTRSWVLRNGNQPKAGVRATDEPAPTMAFGNNAARVEWVLRNNTQANSSRRGLDEPAGTLFFGARGNDVSWVAERPATTVAATDRIAKPGHRDRSGGERQFEDSVRITVEEASVLQSFRPDYPWQGSKTAKFLQIGNAVPPRLAAAVVGAATGLDWQAAIGRLAALEPAASP